MQDKLLQSIKERKAKRVNCHFESETRMVHYVTQ